MQHVCLPGWRADGVLRWIRLTSLLHRSGIKPPRNITPPAQKAYSYISSCFHPPSFTQSFCARCCALLCNMIWCCKNDNITDAFSYFTISQMISGMKDHSWINHVNIANTKTIWLVWKVFWTDITTNKLMAIWKMLANNLILLSMYFKTLVFFQTLTSKLCCKTKIQCCQLTQWQQNLMTFMKGWLKTNGLKIKIGFCQEMGLTREWEIVWR